MELVKVSGLVEVEGRPNRDGPFRIMFVCTGNTCRSPMAEAIARTWLEDKGIDSVQVASAGILAGEGHPASDGARWAASEKGLNLDPHRATLLTEETIRASDLILTMSHSHRTVVEEHGGGGRTHRLKDYAGEHGDVQDPFGGPDHVYESTFREIESLVGQAMTRVMATLEGE